jgi:hypothetical protein
MASLAQRLRTVEAVVRPPAYLREAQRQVYVRALSDLELAGLSDALMRARQDGQEADLWRRVDAAACAYQRWPQRWVPFAFLDDDPSRRWATA